MKYHMVIKFSLMSHKLKLNFSGIEASVIRNYNQVYLIQKNQGGSATAPLGPPAEKTLNNNEYYIYKIRNYK